MPDHQTPDHASMDAIHARLIRLEEAVGFADHTTEQVSTEMVTLHKRIDALVRRIETLEGRLRDVTASIEAGDAGPTASPSDAGLPDQPRQDPTDEELIRNKPPHSA